MPQISTDKQSANAASHHTSCRPTISCSSDSSAEGHMTQEVFSQVPVPVTTRCCVRVHSSVADRGESRGKRPVPVLLVSEEEISQSDAESVIKETISEVFLAERDGDADQKACEEKPVMTMDTRCPERRRRRGARLFHGAEQRKGQLRRRQWDEHRRSVARLARDCSAR